jgi:hypothetical protein
MSYTLRGRIESRLAVLVPVLAAACALALAEHRWWPVEAVALMVGIGVLLDLQVYDRLLSYQPGWLALPLGLLELGLLYGCMRLAGVTAPFWQAAALFTGAWLLAQLLGHAGFPLLRLGYAEDGGELGRFGAVAVVAVAAALAGAGATAYARLPPVVHLSAGVHQGPLVITRREVLDGAPGAVVRGGIVVRASGVTIRNVSVVGGENGITVDGVRDTMLDGVSVSGAKLDGIHVRSASVHIRNCSIDMLGNPYGQGIDISFTMGYGMSMVDGCNIVGGTEGIVTHYTSSAIMGNRVSRTATDGISITEMSMGMVEQNEVRGGLGVGIYCNDRSMCTIDRNTVVDMRPAGHGNPSARGIGVLASFQSEADLHANELGANPVPIGSVMDSLVRSVS